MLEDFLFGNEIHNRSALIKTMRRKTQPDYGKNSFQWMEDLPPVLQTYSLWQIRMQKA
jgi:hypothetical protein